MTVWELVERAAGERAQEVLVADQHGRALTNAAFREEAERAAAGLHALGIAPGDVVSWQLPTTLEAAVLLGACARLGAVQNPIIPVLREREVGLICEQVGPSLIIVPEVWRSFRHGDMARGIGPQVFARDFETSPDRAMRLPSGDPADLPPPPTTTDECRWIYYSSGTTSVPKGARHTDTSVINSSHGSVDAFGFHTGDCYPIAWPISHIGGIAMLISVLRAGGTLALFEAFDPVTTPDRMAEHNPTILGSAIPFFQAYLAAQQRRGDERLFPSLRVCVGGGAPIPREISREVSEKLGVAGIASSWGLTEFPVATSETADDDALSSTVGRPTRGVQVRVVDGELRLKGPQCFLGYVDSSLDAAAFDEDGWFRTGDLGSVGDDGRIRIEGRLKDVIIRNAENISASEIEELLLTHPAIADVAVIGVPDPRTGERVCAVIVAEAGQSIALAGILEFCVAAGLARYKCPERVETVDALPRNAMGKTLKNQLQAALA
ncbi:MAG TPA: AMP-binding protein [Frankiaceae bacterium]|nr:AMP-binding protein [Frankiaceae bacterium]